MPEDSSDPPAAPDPEFRIARDHAATDGLAAPFPAPPVRHVIDGQTAHDNGSDSEDGGENESGSESETPSRRA